MNADGPVTTELKKRTNRWSRQLMEWLGMFVVGAVFLFFFAPASWWQFGVSPVERRKNVSAFTLPKLEGGADWDFADQRGKVVVVNYWATWCGPCRLEIPGFVNVANSLGPSAVEIVGVSLDENTAEIPPFVEARKIPYQILLSVNDPNVNGSGITLPTTFLYDKSGRLAKEYTGMILESTLRSDIESLLTEN